MRKPTLIGFGALLAAVISVGLAAAWNQSQRISSGIEVGGVLGSFHPYHATGADRGKQVCPICQYPSNPAVQVWINGDDEKDIINVATIAQALEKSTIVHRSKKLKAFLVFYNAADIEGKPYSTLRNRFGEMARKNHLNNVALLYLGTGDLPGFRDNAISLDPRVKNTIFVYKSIKLSAKFVNLVADTPGLGALESAVVTVVR